MNWKLAAALFVSWIIVAAALIKGIQSSGKVVYFTATFPYLILAILLTRGLTLPGSMDGLYYYIMPNWNRVYDVQVWRDAAVQVFYSFGIGEYSIIILTKNRFIFKIFLFSISFLIYANYMPIDSPVINETICFLTCVHVWPKTNLKNWNFVFLFCSSFYLIVKH